MTVTVKFTDDSVVEFDVEVSNIKFDDNGDFIVLEDDDEMAVGWIVAKNVKYVIGGSVEVKEKGRDKKGMMEELKDEIIGELREE
jgi:hypothetical protein